VAGDALVEVATEEIADDWADRWRSFHRPLRIGRQLTVRPPWEPPSCDTELDVVIDPGRAFGTGAHPTTRLCLELLLGLVPGGPLLDVGCGSGVLAITAAKLGFGPVVALDLDPAAVEATLANARRNGVGLSAAKRFDLRAAELPRAGTVLANLTRPLLLTLAAALSDGTERLIASGLLREEADRVAAAFGQRGMVVRERREAGEWAALLLS